MVGSVSQWAGSSLYDMLRSLQKEQEELLEATTAETLTAQAMETVGSQAVSSHAASSNLMSRNFASAEREESKYLKASLDSFTLDKQLNNQASNRVNSLLNSLGGVAFESKGADHAPAWYEMQMRRIQNAESAESSERNLDEIKENIEQKAQEAAAPTDANGNPVESLSTGNAGGAAPMPEISGSNPAPAPDVPAATAPAAAPAPMPEVSASAAPSAPSIDIIV